ncbi:cytochrome P450 [Streptomyces sp. NPDC050548]|uniref:cytochrome P450 n=1 Tax=Streptomyces sp. NPDC050548 TaxID=3365629 RepID=UPI0037BD0DD9
MGSVTTPSTDRRATVSLFSRLRTAEGQADPFPIYAELRARGTISPAPWGGHLVTSYSICDQVLRNGFWLEADTDWRAQQGPRSRWNAPSSREISRTLLALNPPEHTRVRRSFGTFDRASVEEICRPVGQIIERLLDTLHERLRSGEADFTALVSEELPVATIGGWLGLPSADWPRLRTLTHEQVFSQELLPNASQLARSDAATAELRTYFTELVRERRAHPGDDPVSAWIRTWDELEPDRDKADEAVYFLALFVVLAAMETTATMLSSMVLRLVEDPERWSLLAEHPDLVPEFVEEALRYDPPLHLIGRVASDDCLLEGTEIRAGEMIYLMMGAAHHDPARYPDPDSFDPRRKTPHLAFGGGIHYCLGAPLARMEAQTLLHRMIARLPRLTLVRRPARAPRVAFRRILNLDVSLT